MVRTLLAVCVAISLGGCMPERPTAGGSAGPAKALAVQVRYMGSNSVHPFNDLEVAFEAAGWGCKSRKGSYGFTLDCQLDTTPAAVGGVVHCESLGTVTLRTGGRSATVSAVCGTSDGKCFDNAFPDHPAPCPGADGKAAPR